MCVGNQYGRATQQVAVGETVRVELVGQADGTVHTSVTGPAVTGDNEHYESEKEVALTSHTTRY